MANLINLKRISLALEKPVYFWAFAIIFRLTIELSYYLFVSPFFEYSGFNLVGLGIKYFESWIIYLLLIWFFPKQLNRISDYLLVYLLFGLLAPLLVFYCFSDANRYYLYLVLLQVFLILVFRNGKPIKLPFVKNGKWAAYWLLVLGSGFVTAWMIGSGGLAFFNLDLTKVYDFRRDVGEVINEGLMGYLNVWATKVFGPALLALSLWKKRYLITFAVFGLHVLWFGISSHKSVLFYPFLILFLWAWFQRTRALSLVPFALSMVVGLSFLVFVLTEDIFVPSMFIRRVFFVPASLTFTYYEFFSDNPFVYWSESITSWFLDYPYHQSTAAEIGNYLDTDAHANNSFISTGYMHAGVAGVILYGVIAGLLFRFTDSLSNRGVPVWLAVAAIIVPSVSLITSADLPTALLTHGFGVALLILLLLRNPEDIKVNEGFNA